MSDGPAFDRYIGIDYSGAQTPTSSLQGLRAYSASLTIRASEVPPPAGTRKYWTRRGLAEWLAQLLSEDTPTLVGIDHGFCFHSAIFGNTGYRSTGPHSWTTSKSTGPPTTTFMWILSAKACAATRVRERERPNGGG